MAFASSKWTMLSSGIGFVGVEDAGSESSAQWARLKEKSVGTIVFLVNHDGPRPFNSGGACGGPAVAYEIFALIKANAMPGDAILLIGSFAANAYSPTLVLLSQQLESCIDGTNRWGAEHVLGNLGPQCTTSVERAENYTARLVLELGSTCIQQKSSVKRNVTTVARGHALAYHRLPKVPPMPPGIPRGPRLAILDMRSWSCRGACVGGGCCNEADCVWECKENPENGGLCNTSRWTPASLQCELFAEAGQNVMHEGHAPDSELHVQTEVASDHGDSPAVVDRRQSPLINFYAYRAMNDDEYELDNVDAANLAGEMYYLNHEVVSASCPRHYGITRILRLKVTMRPTLQVYNSGSEHPLFMGFITFDFGACSGQGCAAIWAKYGFNPGCQFATFEDRGEFRYPNGVWYSFPGLCPSHRIGHKHGECRHTEPGGRCDQPTGEKNCTWNLEPAGEVRLDELSGIENYTKFCQEKKREYILQTDHGEGFSFWDDRGSTERCKERLELVEDLFAKKYPSMPRLPDPPCKLPGTR